MIIYKNSLVFLLTAVLICDVKDSYGQYSQQNVEQFKSLIVWHSSTKQSFLLQKDYLLRLIEALRKYSDITLIILSANRNETLKITKTDSKWLSNFADLRFDQDNEHVNILQSSVLADAIKEHLNHSTTTKIAEELFLVVDDESKIDDLMVTTTLLKKKKTFVICATEKEVPAIWRNLATDINHLLKLTGNDDNISDEQKLITVSFNDSSLYCDVDLYWDDGRCTKCTYQCSMVTRTVSRTCRKKCPYLDRSPINSSLNMIQEDVETVIEDQKGLITFFVILGILIVCGMVCCLFWRFWIRKYCQRQDDVERQQIGLTQNNDNTANTGPDQFPIMVSGNPEQGEDLDNLEEQDEGTETSSFLGYTSQPHEEESNSVGNEESANQDDLISTGRVEDDSVDSLVKPGEREPSKLPIVLEFKDVNELNANGNTFGEPLVKLHEGDGRDDATYVKGVEKVMV